VNIVADSVRVTVPASAGNLGPGFDALGMALGVVDTIEVSLLARPDVVVEVEGEGAGTVATDESHLFVRAFREAFGMFGSERPGLHIRAVNAIPHGQGLGSSAATVVAAFAAARAVLGEPEELSLGAILSLATRFEGHPDNAAPAIYGGAVVCWQDDDGAHASPLTVAPGIETAVLIPHGVVPTVEARASLPPQVPHKDAAFNASRAAVLVHALAGRPELLLAATEDRLHQGYRARHMPQAVAMIERLRGEGLAAVVSGAGPSVLVIGTGLAGAGLETGPLAWADGVGGDTWRSVLTTERVAGVAAQVLA
jgi:homoserine kinase